MSKEVIITGSSGLVGSRIVDCLPRFSFHGVAREVNPEYPGRENLKKYSRYDILNVKELEQLIGESPAEVIVHCAAFFPGVDQLEPQRIQGRDSEAWNVNVKASKSLAEICEKHGRHLILAGTTYVFDGRNGPYTEGDDPNLCNPKIMSFYGIVKREQEKVVADNCSSYSIFRFEMPYRTLFTKPDFARRLLNLFVDGKLTSMFSDQSITPIFLDELARAVEILIESKAQGVFHIGSADITSPYLFAVDLITRLYGSEAASIIQKANYSETPLPEGKAQRPLHGGVLMGKIVKLGYEPKTNSMMIQDFARGFSRIQI